MNRKNGMAVVAGIFTLMIVWLLIIFISSFVVDKLHNLVIAGNYVQDSWSFYNNAHLLEEMYEGKYNPLRDPVFLVSIILLYVPAFFVGALLSRYNADNNLPSYITVAVGMLLVMFILHRDIFNFPIAIMKPICFEFAVIIIAIVIGLYVGKKLKNRRPLNILEPNKSG